MNFSLLLGMFFLVGVEGLEYNSSSLSLDTHFCIQEYFGYTIPSLYEGCSSLVNVNTEMKDFTTNFSYEPSIQQNTFSPNVMYREAGLDVTGITTTILDGLGIADIRTEKIKNIK